MNKTGWNNVVRLVTVDCNNDRNNNQHNDFANKGDKNYPDNKTDAYDILGLKYGASENEIRDAHRQLMKKYHPDTGGDVEHAAIINRAKDILLG